MALISKIWWYFLSGTRVAELGSPAGFQIHAVIDHQNFAAAGEKVVEPMDKTSLVLDMVDVQAHNYG